MTTNSAVGLTTAGDLSTYEIRTITKGRVADNKPWVSSLTDGKTHRAPGNLDRTWAISLYAPDGVVEVPAALLAGETISVQVTGDSSSYDMIIDDASLEIDIEGGELIGISLSCSAVSADSY